MFDIQKAPGFIFAAVDKAYDAALTKRLKAVGITAVQWSLLEQLYQHEGVNQQELAAYCLKDPSSLTKTVDILEKKELIVRKQSGKDRRAYNLYMTAHGVKVRQAAHKIASDVYECVMEGVTQAESDQMIATAMKIFDNIKRMSDH
ncbi:MAG: MarR family transcriptional regulator [Peptococcaceae bacterium]|nr:MarR family transcriptional regulator [Peptococcaceae bacterium]